MARPPSTEPTERELEILQVLWERGPASFSQVCESLRRRRPTASTTVATMLKVMLNKGLVGKTESGPGPRWSARVSRQSARSGMVRRMLDRIFDGSAQSLVAHVLQTGKLTDEQVRELRRLLDEHRSESGRDA